MFVAMIISFHLNSLDLLSDALTFCLLSVSRMAACLASICASNGAASRATAASCTARYAEDLPEVALDAGKKERDALRGSLIDVWTGNAGGLA